MATKKNKSSKKAHKAKSISKANSQLSIPYWAWLIGLGLVVLFVFKSVGEADFVNYDDSLYVTKNEYVTNPSISNVAATFTKAIAANYHPITIISLMVDYAISGDDASIYHWTSLIGHLINTYLSYLFFLLLFGKENRVIGLIGAAIFALHPMHVESVAWISQRKDILFMMFYLLGLNSYLKHKKADKSIIYVFGFFLLSLLSKPSAVTFPVVLVLIDYLLDDRIDWKAQLHKIPFFVLSTLFGLITLNIQVDDAVGDLTKFSLLEKASLASYGLTHYLKNFIFLLPTGTFHPYPGAGGLSRAMSIAPLILLVVSALVIYFGRRNKWVVFGSAFFVVNLLLTLQFIQVGASVVSDRYTYLPYHGLIVIVLYGLYFYVFRPNAQFGGYKNVTYGSLIIWIGLMCYRSTQQVQTWKGSEELWTNVLELFPNSAFALSSRGKHYNKNNEYAKAMADIEIALEVYDKDADLLFTQSAIYRKTKDYAKAIEAASKGLAIEPEDASGYNARANAYLDNKQSALALKDYKRCLELDPDNENAMMNLGGYYIQTKKYDEAITQFSNAISRYPAVASNLENRAVAYMYSQRYEDAISDAIEYGSRFEANANVLFVKSVSLEKLKKYEYALEAVNQALTLAPENANYLQAAKRIQKRLKAQ